MSNVRNGLSNFSVISPPARAGTSMSVRVLLPLTRVQQVATAVIAITNTTFADLGSTVCGGHLGISKKLGWCLRHFPQNQFKWELLIKTLQ